MKKKIAIVITGDNYVRNYMSTNTFLKIEKKYNVRYFVNQNNVSKFNQFMKKKTTKFSYENNDFKKYTKFHLLITYLNENKSKSIKYVVERILKHTNFHPENFLKNIIFFPLTILSKIKKNLIYYIFKALSKNKSKLIYKYKVNQKLYNSIKKFNPKLIIVPTAGQDLSFFDTTRIGKQLKIKTIAIIDNWDNLSSRSHPYPRPDHYVVWGEQSKMHGHKIQSINPKNITVAGASRYDDYFKLREKRLKNYFNFKYALFFEGTGIEDDLTKTMDILEEAISVNKIKNFKIIYRPHPWRKKIKRIDLKRYKHILLDPQFKINYYDNNFRNSFQPDLKYYPSLIKNSEFIISAPTTMVIESLIFYKRIILLAHGKNELFGHYNHVVRLAHVQGLNKFKNIKTYFDKNDLTKMFLNFFNKSNLNQKKSDSLRNYYLFNDNSSYDNRLLKIINKKV